jgi:sulfite exporter TauE/SafE
MHATTFGALCRHCPRWQKSSGAGVDMEFALVVSALLLGLAGAPHCAAMCGAACAAVTHGGSAATPAAFHVSRVAGYALAGAVAASSVGLLSALGQASPALRPLWTLAHAAALALGLWLMWSGHQPAWVDNFGRGTHRATPDAQGWQRMRAPLRAGAAGAFWVAWPCGLLQSALVVAALANSALGGAAVMLAFAVTSAAGLSLGPWLWLRLGGVGYAARANSWATRAAGALLAGVSAWALGHDLIYKFIAYCRT